MRGGLDSIANHLGLSDGEIPFVWLVPEDIFDKMKVPSPLKVGGNVLDSKELKSHNVGKRVVQYAVCVPIPTASAQS